MNILYKKLLNLELWHDYYLGQPNPSQPLSEDYDVSDIVAIVPTPECERILKNLRWRFRKHRSGAIVFAEVDPVSPGIFQTKFPIDRPYQLSFWLVVRDARFANFTNLPLGSFRHLIYYVSNLSDNQQNDTLFLTKPLQPYHRNQFYSMGQLVTYNNQTWEAVRDRTSTTDDPSPDDWEALPASQYISQQDQVPRQGLSYPYLVPQANPGDVLRFVLINVNQQKSFEYEFTVPITHKIGEAITIPLNFFSLAPGFYKLLVQDAEVASFVLADPMTTYNVWGLVEIVLNPRLVPPAFSLLQIEQGQTLIQPRTYVLRFKNRATYWRYRYDRPHGFTPDKLQTLNLHYENDKTYFTQRPQGLLQRPNHLFTDGKDRLLPAPRVAQIQPERRLDPETQKETIAIFSDIYL